MSLDVSQSGAAFRFAKFFLFPGWFCSHMSIWDILRGTTGTLVQFVTSFLSREKLNTQIWTQFGTECTMQKREKRNTPPHDNTDVSSFCSNHCRARYHHCSQHPHPNDQVTFSLRRISIFNKICPTSVVETTRAHPNVSPLGSKTI